MPAIGRCVFQFQRGALPGLPCDLTSTTASPSPSRLEDTALALHLACSHHSHHLQRRAPRKHCIPSRDRTRRCSRSFLLSTRPRPLSLVLSLTLLRPHGTSRPVCFQPRPCSRASGVCLSCPPRSPSSHHGPCLFPSCIRLVSAIATFCCCFSPVLHSLSRLDATLAHQSPLQLHPVFHLRRVVAVSCPQTASPE